MEQAVSVLNEIDPTCPGCRWLMEQLPELREVVVKQGAESDRLKTQRPKTSRTKIEPP